MEAQQQRKQIKISPKYEALWKPTTRYFLITGGRGSAKSFTVGLWACNMLSANINWKMLFTRYTLTSANISVLPEFKEKISLLNIDADFATSTNQIINKRSGSELIFSGIKTSSGNQTAKLKSIPRLNVFIVDEAEEFTKEEDFNIIDESIRMPNVPNIVIIVMNPPTIEHWIWQKWFQNSHRLENIDGFQIPISTYPNVTHIHTTYFDNIDNLSVDYLAKINQLKNENGTAYAHRFLGNWLNKAEGVIYPNWEEGNFDESLPFAYGLDFGFFPDPLALVMVAVDTMKKKIYLKEILYAQNLTYDNVLAKMQEYIIPNALIIADTSEPRLINALQGIGLNVQKADKGHGSIKEGIKIILDFTIVITSDSFNAKNEMRNYIWNDRKSSTPIDADNHICDAFRYASMRLLEGSPLLAYS